ncbi:MAG: metallophosphoesterase [Ignavibacteriaceae bacterium]
MRLLIGLVILVVVEYYFIKKTSLALKYLVPSFYKDKFKILKRIFFVWMNMYPIVLIIVYVYFAITSEYMTMPESRIFDYLFIYPFWIFFILTIQVGIYFLVIDIFKLLLFPFYKKHKDILLKTQSVLVFILTGFFIVYIPARIIYDYNEVSVRPVEYKKSGLPDALNNFRIAFISDLQADHYTDEGRLKDYIDKVNALDTDLILVAGDFITTGPKYIDISANLIGTLHSRYGIFSCIGDHDNWAYRGDVTRSLTEVKNALKKNNVEMIDNSYRMIKVDSATIDITFITYTYVEKIQNSTLDSLVKTGSGDLKIFLTHQPRQHLIDAATKNNYNLFLAGHTHGGQITFLFPFIWLTPTLFETSYIRGDFWFNDILVIVTRGLGMSLAPLRYNSTPEITLITIKN